MEVSTTSGLTANSTEKSGKGGSDPNLDEEATSFSREQYLIDLAIRCVNIVTVPAFDSSFNQKNVQASVDTKCGS